MQFLRKSLQLSTRISVAPGRRTVMTATPAQTRILDGTKCANEKLIPKLQTQVADFTARFNRKPCLTVVRCPTIEYFQKEETQDRNQCDSFVAKRRAFANDLGFDLHELNFPNVVDGRQLLDAIDALNRDDNVDGILTQFPFPKHIATSQIDEAVNPLKDINCLHPVNVGRFNRRPQAYITEGAYENQAYESLTPSIPYTNLPFTSLSILSLLDNCLGGGSGDEEGGPDGGSMSYMTKHCVIIGRNNLVCKPLSLMMMVRGASVSMVHSATPDLEQFVREGDIVISGMGTQHVLDGNWIKPGAIVVDVNVRRIPGTSPSGIQDESDECTEILNYDSALSRASAITPNGNVGFDDVVLSVLFGNCLKSGLYRELMRLEEARWI